MSKPLTNLGDAALLAIILAIAYFDVKTAFIVFLVLELLTKLAKALTAWLERIVEAIKRNVRT